MFECPHGLRQGCVLSPTLFSIIINELAAEVSENGKHGIQLLPGLIELFILLFADDLAFLTSSPTGLQTQLDCLQTVCPDLGLTVNRQKQSDAFRKDGFLGRSEKWFIDGNILEVVSRHQYFDFTFTTTMNANQSAKQLADNGKESLFDLLRTHPVGTNV